MSAAQTMSLADVSHAIGQLAISADQRISTLERAQHSHREEVESRLLRYETSQQAATARIIDAVGKLGRLEDLPQRFDTMEKNIAKWREEDAAALAEVNERVGKIEDQLAQGRAYARGRNETLKIVFALGKWTVEHAWKPTVFAAAIWQLGVSTGLLAHAPSTSQQSSSATLEPLPPDLLERFE
jgi:hypothetical protein